MKTSLFRVLLLLWALSLAPDWARAQTAGPGTALNLYGTNGYAQAPGGVWFSNDFTIEGWVYVRNYNSWSRLIDFADGPNSFNVYLALSFGSEGFPTLGVFTNNNGDPVIKSSNTLPRNEWVHLAATLEGTNGTIYINGEIVASGPLNVPPNVVRTNNYIGHSNYGSDQDADAEFDEVRIWGVARTQEQIKAFMHRSLTGHEPGLEAYYRMDEGTGATLNDSTGNGWNATLVGGTSWSNSTAQLMAGPGSALAFNAPQKQFVSVSNKTDLDAYPMTIMAWFMDPPIDTAGGGLVNKILSTAPNGYQLFVVSNQLAAMYYRDGSDYVLKSGGPLLGGVVNDGNWHHAAFAVDASGGRLYLDGVQKTNAAWTGTPGATTTTLPLDLGYYQGNNYFTGQLAQVSVWNSALSTAQIQSAMTRSLAGTEAGLVAYWPLTEGIGTNIIDNANKGHDGASTNAPVWTNSLANLAVPDPGYAVDLAGTSNYVQAPNGNWFSNAFTIEGWVYVRNFNNWSRLLDFGNGPYINDVYLSLTQGGNGQPALGIFSNGSTTILSSDTTLPLNQWAHLAATFDGTNGAIYINGALTAFGPLPAVSDVETTNNYIGRSAFASDLYADAAIDELRIWNVARSTTQVQSDMNQTLTGEEAGLIGYWRFDEGIGATALDATGNGNDATLMNGSRWRISGAGLTHGPILLSVSAANITGSNATLQAVVNPNYSPFTASFAFGPTTAYGTTNFVPNGALGETPVIVSTVISGLAFGKVYHCLVTVTNAYGTVTGSDFTFVAVNPPTVATLAATDVFTNATLNGTVLPNGTNATTWFQYGFTTNYGNATPSVIVSGTNQAAVAVSNTVNTLFAGFTYHYQIVAMNISDTVLGGDMVFTTAPLPPVIEGQSAVSVGATTAALMATVFPNGADTSVFFNYGATTNYGNMTAITVVPGTNLSAVNLTNLIGNQSPGVPLHYQVVVSNAAGTNVSVDNYFVTPVLVNAPVGIGGVETGTINAGDLENDGALDILTTGGTLTQSYTATLWHNNGLGLFTPISSGLPGVQSGAVALGDFDNDGKLDVLITGFLSFGQTYSAVWRNTGAGFSNINAGLPGVWNSSVAWGDFDNDGRPDILLAGGTQTSGSPITQVWRNTGNGFSNINAGLPGIEYGSVAWGDFDNDGRPDILLTGADGNGNLLTQIWRNTGAGFTNISAPIRALAFGHAAWGDFDNDGLLDVLICGLDEGGTAYTEIWRNTGNGFTNINAGLPGVAYGSALFCDFNNDGRLDVVLSGFNNESGYITQLWLNTTNGFILAQDLGGYQAGSMALGDVNNDGRQDLLLAGVTSSLVFNIFDSQVPLTNTPPAPPLALATSVTGGTMKMAWQPGADAQTPTPGLSYNVRVGLTPGGSDYFGALADSNGLLTVPQRGQFQARQLSLPLPNLPLPGNKIYWSVQSVDTAFGGSPFAQGSYLIRPDFSAFARQPDGIFQAQFNVQSGTNYSVQASTDLVHWLDLLDFNFGASGPVLFTDPAATNYPQRFYRFQQH